MSKFVMAELKEEHARLAAAILSILFIIAFLGMVICGPRCLSVLSS